MWILSAQLHYQQYAPVYMHSNLLASRELGGIYTELSLVNTSTRRVSSRISVSGCVRLTHTST